MKITHTDVMKPTQDWWCPNYENDMVRVTLMIPDEEFMQAMPDCYVARVAVWGKDDMGMDKDFFGEHGVDSAKNLFTLLTEFHEFVNIDTLKSYGLESA